MVASLESFRDQACHFRNRRRPIEGAAEQVAAEHDEVKAKRDAIWMSDMPAAAAEVDLSGAIDARLPGFVPPMLATLVAAPFDAGKREVTGAPVAIMQDVAIANSGGVFAVGLLALALRGALPIDARSTPFDALVAASKVNASGPLVESRTRELLNGLVRSVERVVHSIAA